MPSALIEFGLLILLLIANGVFAMSEIAIVSARKVRLQRLAADGDERAQAALALAESPDRFLSTVQVGITLVGIIAGAFGGATLSRGLKEWLETIPALRPYAGPLSFGGVVALITYLSLVIGELVPKRLGLNNPERIAVIVAKPMGRLSRIASPLVHLLSVSTDLLVRIMGIRPGSEPPVTEEEITVLIQQGKEAGVFQEAEQDLVSNVFRLADRRVSALMTPRLQVEWIDLEEAPDALRQQLMGGSHSRYPVARESLDNLEGVVYVQDLLSQAVQGHELDLRAAMRPATVVPETMPAMRVLEIFRQGRNEQAMVADEYGNVIGLVSMTDILESLVGELPAEAESEDDADIVQRADGSWLVDGQLPIDEVRELLKVRELPGESDNLFQTLGGFVTTQLGKIPTAADRFEWCGYSFEIVDMDGHRVDRVLVCPNVPEPPTG